MLGYHGNNSIPHEGSRSQLMSYEKISSYTLKGIVVKFSKHLSL